MNALLRMTTSELVEKRDKIRAMRPKHIAMHLAALGCSVEIASRRRDHEKEAFGVGSGKRLSTVDNSYSDNPRSINESMIPFEDLKPCQLLSAPEIEAADKITLSELVHRGAEYIL